MATRTSDPVTPAEIAARTGYTASYVRVMATRGLIPKPDWTSAGTGIWAWEKLRKHPRIKAKLDELAAASGEAAA